MDILKKFNKDEMYVLNLIKNVCLKLNVKGYIVGGAIRDFILDEKIRDIDICIECNPIKIIEKLDYIKTYKYYDKFQTSTIVFNNNIEVDLIRTRKEEYSSEGALPKISPSSIYDDLLRRDFRVNALAYDIIDNIIIDPFNGYYDIKERKIRQVHSFSYGEDPTRIFRAVKYASRYSFFIDSEDIKDIKYEIKKGCFNNISNDRIIREIILICNEDMWTYNIKMFAYFNIFNINLDIIHKKSNFINLSNLEDRIMRLFLAIEDDSQRKIFINNSILNKDLRGAFKNFKDKGEKAKNILNYVRDNCEIYEQLKKFTLTELRLIGFCEDLYKYKILNYIKNLNYIKLNISGEDLKRRGINKGKIFKDIFKDILKIKLNTYILDDKSYLEKNLGEILDGIKYKD